jgi:protein-disulfide isomerase
MGTTRSILLAVTVALALSACSGDNAGLTAALVGPEGSQTADKAGFNPFTQVSETAQSAREVIAKPTLLEAMQPGGLPEMSWGRTDAPVTLVQYASMTCPHCRKFHADVYPELKRAFIDTGKVRYILREFPIGKSSGTATIALRCAPAEKYLPLYGKFMEQQGNWVSQEVRTDQIIKVASQVGINGADFDACLKNQDMLKALTQIKDRGRQLGVIGTPNFFVNTKTTARLVKGTLTLDDIRQAVAAAEAAPTAQAPTGSTKVN